MFTGEDVRVGQEVFLRNGIMQYGSIFGHGADFTADYLHRSALDVGQQHARANGSLDVLTRRALGPTQDARATMSTTTKSTQATTVSQCESRYGTPWLKLARS